MAAAAETGGGGLSAALTSALETANRSQTETLQFQEGLNASKQQFQARSASLQMEDAMSSKMSSLVQAQARALAQ